MAREVTSLQVGNIGHTSEVRASHIIFLFVKALVWLTSWWSGVYNFLYWRMSASREANLSWKFKELFGVGLVMTATEDQFSQEKLFLHVRVSDVRQLQ